MIEFKYKLYYMHHNDFFKKINLVSIIQTFKMEVKIMNDNEIKAPKKNSEEKRYKIIPIEFNGDDVKIIARYIEVHPELD